MDVDPPSREKGKSPIQYDEQGNTVPACVLPTEELLSIQLISRESDTLTRIGSQLSPTLVGRLTTLLRENTDVFAWSTPDLVGINPNIAVHSLNLDPIFPPVKQKKR
ncbi:hypothetical protein Sango_2820400 [Sesamum angolense]|uniref:Reverse transcriptase domain-containing protein n=1 Tax=Sesamum angolense TaxID=2727404 RepID=A0AAE1T7J9_9LAMI|nr:hypothetical protein Sango_2820400 [Sesamum angolense]